MGWTYTALTEKSEAKLIEITTDDGSLVFVNGTSSSSKTLSIIEEGFTPYSFKWEKKNSDGTYTQVGTARTYIVAGVANVGTYRATAYEDANDNVGHSDMVTIASVSDGQGGSSPYLFSLSNENFTINTTNDLKPTTSLNYEVKVTGYHGSSVMTSIASGTPTAEQFKITIPSGSIFSLKTGTTDTLVYAANTSTALSNENLAETITIAYDTNKSETKTITVSCAKNGISPTVTQGTGSVTITDASGNTGTVSDGANGVSVSSVTEYYQRTNSATAPAKPTSSSSLGSWKTTVDNPISSAQYLYNCEIIKFSNNTETVTNPVQIAKYVTNGTNGKGISSIQNVYKLTTNTTAPSAPSATDAVWTGSATGSTSDWGTVCPTTTTTNKYLWNVERVTYDSSPVTYSVSTVKLISTHGETGTRGTLNFTGTEINTVDDDNTAYTITTASTGVTSNSMEIIVGDTYTNSLTFDTWACSTAGTASTAKWTYKGRKKSDNNNTNNWRFFGDGTRTQSVLGGINITVSEVNETNPFGKTSKLFKATRAANTTSSEWVTPYYKTNKVDSSVTYRYACYVKKTGSTLTINYLGPFVYEYINSYVTNLSGGSVDAAYHSSSRDNWGNLNKWVLLIGYVVASNLSEAPADSGVYSLETKEKLASVTNFRWKSGITRAPHSGTLIEYGGAITPTTEHTSYVYEIRFDKCDGTEPSVEELLNGTAAKGSRAPRYLGSVAQSNPTTTNPTFSGVTTINGDWYLNTSDGIVYLRTANNAWTAQSTTTPNQYHLACINDMVSLLGTTNDATVKANLQTICDSYVDKLLVGTALINKLFAKQITLQTGGVIQSSDYAAHTSSSMGSGFKISSDGAAEFNGSSLAINGQKLFYDKNGNFIIGESYFSTTGDIGRSNLCIGESAGLKQTAGAMFNIAIGAGALENKTSKSNNTAIGTVSMQNAIEPVACTAVGASSLQYTTTGTFNSALGSSAGKSCSSGEHNIFLGTYSGNDCTTGSHNVFIHSETGSSNHNNISTGSFNVIIGSPKMNQVTDTSNLTYINNAIKHQNGILYANTNTTASDSPTWKQVLTVGDTVSEAITAYSGVWGRLGGANQASSTNWTDLIAEITGYSSGGGICGGSICTSAADKGIPAGWYNFLYVPHRTGIGDDNYQYGTLFVIPMTSNTDHFYIIHHIVGTVYDAMKISQTPNKASTAETANKIRIGNSSPENGDIWIE